MRLAIRTGTHLGVFIALMAAITGCQGRDEATVPEALTSGAATVPEDARPPATDADIELAVRSELTLDDGVAAHNLTVSVDDGIVTLHGASDDLLGKQRAVRITEYIRGVRGVVDRIVVHPSGRTDAAIEADVRDALLMDPATESFEITTGVEGGSVRLSGTVDSFQEREVAEHVTAGVVGVREVHNELVVTYPDQRPDFEIEADIRRRLEIDNRVDAGPIDVRVEDHRAILSGTVGSAAERRVAAGDAWVSGVREVDFSGLEIRWFAEDGARRKQAPLLDDAEIRQAVLDTFQYDPRMRGFEPIVLVEGGAVTLMGTVGSVSARDAAEADARNTVGVWRVRNLLEVEPGAAIDDAEIVTRVQRALGYSAHTFDDGLTVTARNGRVRLDGVVDSAYESNEAARIAGNVGGVVDVDNSLEVSPRWVGYNDWELRQDLEKHLLWDARIDDRNLTVEVSAGVAVIRGEVDDWTALRAIQDNARALGVREVLLDVSLRHGGPEALRSTRAR